MLLNQAIGQMGRVFTNGQGDGGSVPDLVIPKTKGKKKKKKEKKGIWSCLA